MATIAQDHGGESILTVLTKQHREVDELFEQLARAAHEPDRARQLFTQLADHLVAHARAEELVVYAHFADVEGLAFELDEAREEHANVVGMLVELRRMTHATSAWFGNLRVLAAEVRRHVAEEENELFPAARQLLTPEDDRRLAREFRGAYDDIAPHLTIPSVGITVSSVGTSPRR